MCDQRYKNLAVITILLIIQSWSTNAELLVPHNNFQEMSQLSSNIIAQIPRTAQEHCYALITDHIYEEILTTTFYHPHLKLSTFILIKIKNSEDLLSPNYRTIKSLLASQKSGCGVYLILISNGIQAGRFLKFIEKFRILNPRALYILLHDYRLFVQDLHYIWKRFINVVFIKEYSHLKKTNYSNGRLFELSTVPFPKVFDGILVSRRLDFWRNGKFRNGVELFFSKTQNLKGKLMKIAVLEHTPAVFKEIVQNKTSFYGVEVELIKALSVALNFNVELYESNDSEKERWGHKLINGTITGLYGEVVNDQSDFGLGDLHYTHYNLELIDLSVPYSTECLTFLTPQAFSDNSWKVLILPFKEEMWLGVLTSLFCGGFVFYSLSKIKKILNYYTLKKPDHKIFYITNLKETARRITNSKDIFDDLTTCIIYTYSMLLVVSLPRLPKSWSIRLLTGWYWIYCLLIAVAYRASMTAILALPVPKITIDTLEQLAGSSITCATWGEENKLFFTTSLDEAGQKIGTKLVQTEDVENTIQQIIRGELAYFENLYFLKDIRSKRTSKHEQETLHIMKECVIHMPVSLGLQKNSPIKPVVDKYIRNIIESGLLTKWLSDVSRKFESNLESDSTSSANGYMNLKKFYGAFISLFIGYGLAIMMLICENLYWKYITQRHSTYDKLIIGRHKIRPSAVIPATEMPI